MAEDELFSAQEEVQKLTNSRIEKVDKILAVKRKRNNGNINNCHIVSSKWGAFIAPHLFLQIDSSAPSVKYKT